MQIQISSIEDGMEMRGGGHRKGSVKFGLEVDEGYWVMVGDIRSEDGYRYRGAICGVKMGENKSKRNTGYGWVKVGDV
jgi:hypothetical protein